MSHSRSVVAFMCVYSTRTKNWLSLLIWRMGEMANLLLSWKFWSEVCNYISVSSLMLLSWISVYKKWGWGIQGIIGPVFCVLRNSDGIGIIKKIDFKWMWGGGCSILFSIFSFYEVDDVTGFFLSICIDLDDTWWIQMTSVRKEDGNFTLQESWSKNSKDHLIFLVSWLLY